MACEMTLKPEKEHKNNMFSFLKKLFVQLLLIAVMAGSSLWVFHKLQPVNIPAITKSCSVPVKFSIGAIDPRFKISQVQLQKMSTESANVWNKAAGESVLEYDPSASLKIQLTYDERQQTTDAQSKLEADLKGLSAQQVNLDKQYGNLNKKYNSQLADFKKGVADYEKRLADYNQEVDLWNKQGGAPQSEFDKLASEKKDLASAYDKLQSQESDLKKLEDQINSLAAKENKIVNNYNSQIKTFQTEYGTAQEFEKGVFDPTQGITIYQFRQNDDLQMTIIHELGHAIGLDHVQNPKSIMYYLMGQQNLNNPTPTAEDVAELKNVCQIN